MANFVPVEVFDLIIFGGTGDLAMRKLLPALYHRQRDGQIVGDSRVIAASRGELSRANYLSLVEEALRANLADGEFDADEWGRFAERLHYVQADAFHPDAWHGLADLLSGAGEGRTRVAYLSTAPSLFGPIAHGLKQNGLITDDTRIVLEKPLGHDYESASEINNAVGQCFSENQIYRIDHYLGKETVQNLLALRFANSLFEPMWRRGAIDHVQITVAEDLGVEGRVEFYDSIGALAGHGSKSSAAARLSGRDGAALQPAPRRRSRREDKGAASVATDFYRQRADERRARAVQSRCNKRQHRSWLPGRTQRGKAVRRKRLLR